MVSVMPPACRSLMLVPRAWLSWDHHLARAQIAGADGERDHGHDQWQRPRHRHRCCSVASARRTELAAFLRAAGSASRPRTSACPPAPPPHRRPAPRGARPAGRGRRHLVHLARAGPQINASVQVLDAIATTLRLDATERADLFRLADVPGGLVRRRLRRLPAPARSSRSSTRSPLPAAGSPSDSTCSPGTRVRVDLPRITSAPPGERNTLLATFRPRPAAARSRIPIMHCGALVAQLRGRLRPPRRATPPGRTSSAAWRRSARRSRRLGRPRRVHADQPTPRISATRVGPITTTTTSSAVNASRRPPVVDTPDDEQSRHALARLAAGDQLAARFPAGPLITRTWACCAVRQGSR